MLDDSRMGALDRRYETKTDPIRTAVYIASRVKCITHPGL